MNFARLIRESLTPSTVLTPAVFFIMLGWNLVANILDVANMNPELLPLRLLIVLVVHGLHWAAIRVTASFWSLWGQQLRGMTLLSVLLIIAALRGALLQETFRLAGINPLVDIWVRLTFSVLYVGLGTVVIAIWLQQIRQHNRLLANTIAEQERLNQVRHQAENRIFEANQKLISAIQKDLLQRVNRLSDSNPLATLAELRDSIDHVVRPMSEQLAYKETDWQPEPVIAKRVKVSWRRVIAESFYVDNMHPFAVTVILITLIAPSAVNLLGFEDAWPPLLIAGACHVVTLWLYQRLARRAFSASSRPVQRRAVLTGFALAGVVSTIVSRLLVNPNIPNALFPLQNLVFTLVIGVVLCLVAQSLRAMSSIERDLAAATAEASWEITRIRQIHRELERGLANKLHGKIQGTLAASYLKLARAISEGQASEAPLSGYKDLLIKNIADLAGDATRPIRLNEVIAETIETWADVCQIDCELGPELRSQIERDSLLCHALEDVIPELAFNSVKHGNATSLHFVFELIDGRTLQMDAHDNGRQAIESGRVGLGSKLLDDCCIAWNRSSGPEGTITRCQLPVKQL